ncbi:MAG: TIM barrel protein [Phycisphaera sp.]|nr:TIM barrel protein [Phycisphaera sp.]
MAWILSAFADEASESVDDQIAVLKETQIDHVDLRCVDGVNICDLPVDHAKEVKAKLDDAGISVCMYGSPIGKLDIADDFEVDVNRLRRLGELKRVFGAEKVRLFSYYNQKADASDDEWTAESLRRLGALTALAEEVGLVLYHENELGVFGHDLKTVGILRDELRAKSDAFKLIFDFDNYNQIGEDPWTNWQTLGAATDAIHLKESSRQPDGSFQHVPAGEGDGNIARTLADLASRGWSGPLTLEPHLARSPAVLATGPHGQANQSLNDMSDAECFVVAAQAARKLLRDVDRL